MPVIAPKTLTPTETQSPELAAQAMLSAVLESATQCQCCAKPSQWSNCAAAAPLIAATSTLAPTGSPTRKKLPAKSSPPKTPSWSSSSTTWNSPRCSGGSQIGSSKKPPPSPVPTTVLQPPAVTSPMPPPAVSVPARTTQTLPSGKTTMKPGGLVSTSPDAQTISSTPKSSLMSKAQSVVKTWLAWAPNAASSPPATSHRIARAARARRGRTPLLMVRSPGEGPKGPGRLGPRLSRPPCGSGPGCIREGKTAATRAAVRGTRRTLDRARQGLPQWRRRAAAPRPASASATSASEPGSGTDCWEKR